MELIQQNLRRFQLPRLSLHLQLPLHIWLMLDVFLGILFMVAAVTALTRSMQPPLNPFSSYGDVLPGHPKQAALARGFTCFANVFDDSESCTRIDEPASRLFSGVHLSTLGDHIYSLSFDVYADTLTIGDLVLLWGRPAIQRSGRVAQVHWSSPSVTALAVVQSARPLNDFTPVAHISFITPKLS